MALKENLEIFAVKQALSFMDKDPENNLPRLLDWFDRFDRKDTLKIQREVIREAVINKDNNWHQLVMSLWKDIDPGGATACSRILSSMAVCWDFRSSRKTGKNTTAIFPGRSCWIPPVPAI